MKTLEGILSNAQVHGLRCWTISNGVSLSISLKLDISAGVPFLAGGVSATGVLFDVEEQIAALMMVILLIKKVASSSDLLAERNLGGS